MKHYFTLLDLILRILQYDLAATREAIRHEKLEHYFPGLVASLQRQTGHGKRTVSTKPQKKLSSASVLSIPFRIGPYAPQTPQTITLLASFALEVTVFLYLGFRQNTWLKRCAVGLWHSMRLLQVNVVIALLLT
jgi:hypothetical protein